mmetsp:Transcript_6162/g.12862  ORF Transcript_6162/g.12862 Transcript_6162/m.12862 type:complete len:592 (-) Transcript_6162:12-1787(-)
MRATATDQEEHDDENETENAPYDPNVPPLDDRVIAAVRSAPNHTIRPARLSSDLGISIEDATAELCGLLRAVGGGENGASFTFETIGCGGDGSGDEDISASKTHTAETASTMTMVFTFPSNFEARAKQSRRKDDVRQSILSAMDVFVRALKVFVAFGLILSLAILSVASILAMVAALIAMSRGGGDGRSRSAVLRRMRSAFFTLRQLLWCYAVFGPGLDSGHDPFLRQTAGDIWLLLSMFCGNPMSIGFWWRAEMLNRRRRRWGQGWGSRHYGGGFGGEYGDEDGEHLLRQGEWGQENSNNSSEPSPLDEEGYRGLLSVVVEFLFGPSPFWPGPTESEKWKVRGSAVMSLSTSPSRSGGQGLSLEELSPYADNPPASLENSAGIVSEGLRVVSHFNGVPAASESDYNGVGDNTGGKARFVFPELIAEAASGMTWSRDFYTCDHTASSWDNILYSNPSSLEGPGQRLDGGNGSQQCLDDYPKQLFERPHVLTKLQRKQFGQCVVLGALNYIGVYWLRQSIRPGGLLEISNQALLFTTADGVLSVLHFYAKLFFALPLGRLALIVLCNYFISERNRRRASLAEALEKQVGVSL